MKMIGVQKILKCHQGSDVYGFLCVIQLLECIDGVRMILFHACAMQLLGLEVHFHEDSMSNKKISFGCVKLHFHAAV